MRFRRGARRGIWVAAWLAAAAPASACETALLLLVDVSNSVDSAEYRLQIDGMADALLDPTVTQEMLRGQVALSVIQWSGAARQDVSIPWQRIRSLTDIAAFAERARALPRAFHMSDTAPAEAIYRALDAFAEVSDCRRKVIDVSGDGTSNAGSDARAARTAAERAGVTINGIAIESLGLAITNFYRNAIITSDGFVMTAGGHHDYPRAIRAKILREVARIMG